MKDKEIYIKRRIENQFAASYLERAQMPLSAEDIAYAFRCGMIQGRKSLWNRVGSANRPSEGHARKQIVMVVMLTKEAFDLDVIYASEYDAYINNKNVIGVPVLWGYLDNLLFKNFKPTKPPFAGGERENDLDDQDGF